MRLSSQLCALVAKSVSVIAHPGVFFSRRNLLVITLGILAIYFVAICGIIVQRKITYDHHMNAIKAEEARINALSPAEKAILKAEKYEIHMIGSAHPVQRLFFDYLQRTYTLNPKLSVEQTSLTIPDKGPGHHQEIDYLARIAFPNIVYKDMPTSRADEGMLYTNIYSANCDNFPLPDDFWPVMQGHYEQGGYYVTHVALALAFMKDNNCSLPENAKELAKKITNVLTMMAADPETKADLRYEAIVMLQLTGHRDLVQEHWVYQIIDEQLSNGSWPVEAGGRAGDEHATLLALWVLLQYSRPDVPYQPLIRHSQ